MKGPNGIVLTLSPLCTTRVTMMKAAPSMNAQNVPSTTGSQPSQPSAAPTLPASFASFLN